MERKAHTKAQYLLCLCVSTVLTIRFTGNAALVGLMSQHLLLGVGRSPNREGRWRRLCGNLINPNIVWILTPCQLFTVSIPSRLKYGLQHRVATPFDARVIKLDEQNEDDGGRARRYTIRRYSHADQWAGVWVCVCDRRKIVVPLSVTSPVGRPGDYLGHGKPTRAQRSCGTTA